MPLMRPNLLFESKLKYDLGKLIPFMTDPAGQYDILQSAYCTMIKKLPVQGTYTIVKFVYRPDLIAYAIYKDVKYKIPLMLYNDIYTFKECYQGRTINYPSIQDFDELLFSLANSTA